jgi:hypothetical protein
MTTPFLDLAGLAPSGVESIVSLNDSIIFHDDLATHDEPTTTTTQCFISTIPTIQTIQTTIPTMTTTTTMKMKMKMTTKITKNSPFVTMKANLTVTKACQKKNSLSFPHCACCCV